MKTIKNETNIAAAVRLSTDADKPECILIPIIAWVVDGQDIYAIMHGAAGPVPIETLFLYDDSSGEGLIDGVLHEVGFECFQGLIDIRFIGQRSQYLIDYEMSIQTITQSTIDKKHHTLH